MLITSIIVLSATVLKRSQEQGDPRKVFVVHGRNSAARNAIFALLRALGLQPMEWEEAVNLTSQGSPYIGTC